MMGFLGPRASFKQERAMKHTWNFATPMTTTSISSLSSSATLSLLAHQMRKVESRTM